jgi:divalent metal cation (Fe/Co/Zn/Cd) transporter
LKNASHERISPKSSSTAAVYAALIGGVLVAISKAGAAIWTGSAVMTSEAIHSIVDTTNEIIAARNSSLPSEGDTDQPFGYGRELNWLSLKNVANGANRASAPRRPMESA